METSSVVLGITYDKNVARINVLGLPEKPDPLAKLFIALAKDRINVEIIAKGGVTDGATDLSFTTALTDLNHALAVIDSIHSDLGYREATHETELVKVSIVGAAGIASTPGVAAKMIETISSLGVSILLVSTSQIKMSCIIKLKHLADVVCALNTAFDLDASEPLMTAAR